MAKKYKTKELYICFTLNKLVQELDIDLYGPSLEQEMDRILLAQKGVSKMEISDEIRSNHFQTNKILEHLKEKGHVSIEPGERSYVIKITREGILYIRKYNEFFLSMYQEIIHEHYRFKKLPAWLDTER